MTQSPPDSPAPHTPAPATRHPRGGGYDFAAASARLEARREALFYTPLTGPAAGQEIALPWAQLMNVAWDGKAVSVTVLDPQQPAVIIPDGLGPTWEFMDYVRSQIAAATIVTRRLELANGTRVVASIRRAEDGELFSSVVAYGPVLAADERAITALEQQVLDDVGLAIDDLTGGDQ